MHKGLSLSSALLVLALATALSARADESDLRTWTNDDGRQMQAVLVDLEGDVAVFRRDDGRTFRYPVNRLSDEDRTFIADNPPAPGSGARTDSSPDREPSKVGRALKDNLVTSTGSRRTGRFGDYGKVENADYFAFYYSASWCGPCRQVTPDLVRAYNRLKRDHDNFELILFSFDRSRNNMAEYMSDYSMPWPAIDYARRNRVEPAAEHSPRGIPALVILDRDGNLVTSAGGVRGVRQTINELERLLEDG